MRDTITLTGIILAGGASSRMRFPKHSISVNGITLLDRQVKLLREIKADAIFVSVANMEQLTTDYPLLVDKYPGIGPLGALATALEDVKTSHAMVLAVDLPDLKREFLLRLLAQCTETSGIVPVHSNGDMEPLCAVYPVAGKDLAVEQIRKNAHSVKGFVSALLAAGLMNTHTLVGDEMGMLRNVNYPEDL
ncbi:MAG: molybdenum cofactor guanylyltransferase [Chthoniobacterales bacterium]